MGGGSTSLSPKFTLKTLFDNFKMLYTLKAIVFEADVTSSVTPENCKSERNKAKTNG